MLEGLISFLILLGIAMPLKYALDLPQAVKFVGMAHGFLFVLYLLSIAWVTLMHRWSVWRVLGLSSLPSFLLDLLFWSAEFRNKERNG